MAGLVQSAFFWGYMLSQLPGGIAVNRFSGRRVLPAGVALWSLATAVLPVCSTTTTLLCVSRAVVGVGEAVAPSSITDIVAKGVPKEERSRAVSFIFGGLQVGSIAGLLLAPELIKAFGWQSVFYIFGGAGLVWVVWWERLVSDIRSRGGENNPGAVPPCALLQALPLARACALSFSKLSLSCVCALSLSKLSLPISRFCVLDL